MPVGYLMNLLWISHNIPYPPKTGVLQRNYNLLREASRHADIYLLAVFKRDILPGDYDIEAARHELGKLCRHIEIVHLPIEESQAVLYWKALVSLVTRDPLSANWVKDSGMRRQLHSLVDGVPFDLVHFDTVSLAAYRNDVGSVPKILNHHNIESHLLKRRIAFEPIRSSGSTMPRRAASWKRTSGASAPSSTLISPSRTLIVIASWNLFQRPERT